MFVADYVLMEYGTGAIMAVPAHDERDYEFAEKFGLEIRRVVECGDLPCAGDGPAGQLRRASTACHNREALRARSSTGSSRRASARRSVNYRLRDWLLSRQRYWGCPIPIVYCEEHGIVPVPDDQLPVELPDVAGLRARRAGRRWRRPRTGCNTTCPKCGEPARRETDTMDTFVDSSWYFLRYCDPRQRRGAVRPRDRRRLDAGRPVHRRRRARDPAPALRALLRQGARGHGLPGRAGAVRAAVHPGDDHARRREDVQVEGQRGLARRRWSTATARTPRAATSCSSGPPSQDADWSDEGVGGVHRFLSRLWTRGRRGARRRCGEPDGEPTDAAAQGALGDRQGHARHAATASPSTPRSRR